MQNILSYPSPYAKKCRLENETGGTAPRQSFRSTVIKQIIQSFIRHTIISYIIGYLVTDFEGSAVQTQSEDPCKWNFFVWGESKRI